MSQESAQETATAAIDGTLRDLFAPAGDAGAEPAKTVTDVTPPDGKAQDAEPKTDDAKAGDEGADGKEKAGDDKAPSLLAIPKLDATDIKADFAVFDGEDKPIEGIPHVVIEYKANGKVRKDRLDQVVRLAQFGVYNHQREQEFVAKQAEVEEVAEGAIAQLEQREAQLRHLLENEDAYEKVREKYLAENSPEKRAARAEAESRELRESTTRTTAAAAGAAFYESEILPSLDGILDSAPEVEPEELMAKFRAGISPVMRDGIVPRSAYQSVKAFVETELRDWATATNARRTSRGAESTRKAEGEAEKAKLEAARAKRAQAEASAPSGISPAPAQRKPVDQDKVTVNEAMEGALGEILQGLT